MSDTPLHDSEVEEGSPFGGAECEDSSPEPAMQDEEDGENFENLYPIQNLSVEYYEGGEETAEPSNTNDNAKIQDASEMVEAEMSTENDETLDDSHVTTESAAEDMGLSYDESYNSNQESLEQDYKLQKTYIEDFIYSSAPSSSFDESSNSNFEDGKEESKGSALARFPKIVRAIEVADYEILQVLYQLLYQRSAWDTQEILTQRILEFCGFGFSQNSEDYFNREMMLQTQPNEVLIKVASLLGLDQVQKVIADMDKARAGLIQCIMTFLSRPNKKTRTGRTYVNANSTDNDNGTLPPSSAASPSKCGCRSQCFKQIPIRQRQVILEYVKDLEEKKMLDSYLMHMIEIKKIVRKPGSYEDLKKLKEVTYQYYIKYGTRELNVCKGAFVAMYNQTASKILQLQNKLKSGKGLPPKIELKDFPPMTIVEASPRKRSQNGIATTRPSVPRIRPMAEKKEWISSEEQIRKLEADAQKVVPKVTIQKLDAKPPNDSNNEMTEDSDASKESTLPKKEKYQLKDFPLVVKAIESAPAELLIDVHFLLFLNSADEEKLKENILEFDGFSFGTDTEEYDERTEFLQRMSFKMVSDVAKSFSLAILSKKEDTITNILTFLTKPDEKFLRVSATMPLSLSDVDLDDDLGDFSDDSDVSITCEVVEKKVECIDILSSGEDSDQEGKPRKTPQKVAAPSTTSASSIMKNLLLSTVSATPTTVTPTATAANTTAASSLTGGKRTLRNFETIRKIVNTHPHEYLVDIFDLLYLKTHEPSTLRSDILDFSGFTFEKGTPDYIKRKQLLDRMLYNSVRRIYNTLIHNTTEVKVFSKPTMIAEIFQFLFQLPDHDTSVRPPPSAKTPFSKPSFMPTNSTVRNSPGAAIQTGPSLNQSAKLSDLKRVFQRVACFPCEYLIDVHKLLFMTDCDQNVIRQNIFAFKGFPFSPDSHEFQQRKMYLEYLTFHSLRKISSVLTTRSVDLRNSTKHELATHLTEVLAEYCKMPDVEAAAGDTATDATNSMSNSAVENIVVTPIIDPSITGVPTYETSPVPAASSEQTTNSSPVVTPHPLAIAIVDTRSVNTPSVVSTPPAANKRSRKRKNNTVSKVIKNPPASQQNDPQSQFADINLPEVEQYRQIYGANLNTACIYPTSGPTITGITFNANGIVPQSFPQIIPQTLSFPVAYSQGALPVVQQTNQLVGSTIVTNVPSNQSETIIPGDKETEEPPSKKANTGSSNEKAATDEANSIQNKPTTDDEDCDKPLSSLVGHPIDSVLKKHVVDIVEESDLQNITINGVIQKIFGMYPKFDLSYRKEFLKSSLRSILYRLGQEKSSEAKSDLRDTESPDCSVTTTENCDNVSESPKAMDCAQ